MDYDKDIINLLILAGSKGISVKKISQYVFYNSNTFFDAVPYEEVLSEVKRFIHRGIRRKHPFLEHAEKRSLYRINIHTKEGRQLLAKYKEPEEKQEKFADELPIPSLFDGIPD